MPALTILIDKDYASQRAVNRGSSQKGRRTSIGSSDRWYGSLISSLFTKAELKFFPKTNES